MTDKIEAEITDIIRNVMDSGPMIIGNNDLNKAVAEIMWYLDDQQATSIRLRNALNDCGAVLNGALAFLPEPLKSIAEEAIENAVLEGEK